VIADLLDEFHHVAGEQDGRAGVGEPLEQPADHVGGHRVHPLQGLVEEEHLGVVDQGAAEGGLLPHAGGVVGDEALRVALQVQDVEELGRALPGLARGKAMQAPGVLQQLHPGQPVEQPHLGGNDANDGLGRGRVGPDANAVDQHRPRIWPQQARHHGQGRGLPGAVRADEAGQRSPGDVEVDPGDRFLAAEALAQPAHRDRRLSDCLPGACLDDASLDSACLLSAGWLSHRARLPHVSEPGCRNLISLCYIQAGNVNRRRAMPRAAAAGEAPDPRVKGCLRPALRSSCSTAGRRLPVRRN
jgi:hypothetical protein